MPKTVFMSRVITETEFLRRSHDLEESISRGKFSEFCEVKITDSSSATEKSIWNFMKVSGGYGCPT